MGAAPRSAGRALLLLESRARACSGAAASTAGAACSSISSGGLVLAPMVTGSAATAAATTLRPSRAATLLLPSSSWRAFSSSSGSVGPAGSTPTKAGATAGATPAATAAARPAAAAAAAAATPPPLPPRPPPLPKIRSADQLSPEELHAALPSMLFTTSNLILSTLVAAAVAAVGLVAMFWLGTNLRQIAGAPPPPPPPAAKKAHQPSLAEMVAARRAELEREAAELRALPQTREVRARAAEVRRELAVFAGSAGGGGWLDAGAWCRWLTGRGSGSAAKAGGGPSPAQQP